MDATDLAFAGAARQSELLRTQEVSPRELVETYLRRIERIDPELNAYRKVLAERALLEADQAGARLRSGDERPLLGIPVAVKDDLGVAGEVRTDGTNAYGDPEPEDWEVVRRLRAAGAILLGITNVPELTIWPFTETPTWGITRNPWDTQRTSGGSSGGSGAAVAAGLAPLATGSDGGGSIRIPAACCGLVGLKPQRDRIPYHPAGPHWHGLSVVGGLGRTVEDVGLFYEAVTGLPWGAAAARDPGPLRVALSFKVPDPLRATVAPENRRAAEEVADALRALGHTVVERDPDYGSTASLRWFVRFLCGIADDAAAVPHPERLERRTRRLALAGRLVRRPGLRWAMEGEQEDARRINRIFDDVDVVLTPGLATLPQPVGRYSASSWQVTLNGSTQMVPFQAIWNHVGNPSLTFPAGMSAEGLPLSVQVSARPDGEETLLALAGQVERARPWADRRPALAA